MQNSLLPNILLGKALRASDIEQLLSGAVLDKAGQDLFEVYLLTLKRRGVTDSEMLALVHALLSRAKRLSIPGTFLDVCGTGGDKSGSFNISTTTAFVLAACSVPVLKHGNRAVSSKTGSSDLLEGLGISLERASKLAKTTLKACGLGYLHAPLYHPFFASIAPLRKRIAQPTVLNLLGPLLHPASPQHQLVGIGDEAAFTRYGTWLAKLGRKHALVVRSEDGLDEATPYGATHYFELKGGRIRRGKLSARELGFKAKAKRDIAVNCPSENRAAFLGVLSGKDRGPKREAVLLNAGLGLMAFGREGRLKTGLKTAAEAIDSGSAYKTFVDYRKMTR